MAKQHGVNEVRETLNKSVAANKKAALRNNVVLLEACSNGKLKYIKTSIDSGADVHYLTEDNQTPLLRCCRLQSHEEAEKCILYLIKRGADANFQDKYGRTVMSHMAEQGKTLVVEFLLSDSCYGDPTVEDVKGNTPLMYAVLYNNPDIVCTFVGYFLGKGYPIDKRNLVGNTPLILAAKMGMYEVAKTLVELGSASIHLRDVGDFRSAVDWIRVTAPEHLDEFIALDPILVRKRDSALRRNSTTKPKYRILSDFFTDGKMPSCWRSSSKGMQEPRKHTINRTICIVSDKHPGSDYDDTIDSILHNLSDHPTLPSVLQSDTPRSMFDIPNLTDLRSSTEGRFMDRSDSVLSIVSAPSPTLPSLLDDQVDRVSPTTPSPPAPPAPPQLTIKINKRHNTNHRKMDRERRRSLDYTMLSRPQVSSPTVSSPPPRKTSRAITFPGDPLSRTPQRTTSDPLPRAPQRTDPLTRTPQRSASDPVRKSEAVQKISHRRETSRKTSLPCISKTNRIVAADSYVRS